MGKLRTREKLLHSVKGRLEVVGAIHPSLLHWMKQISWPSLSMLK